MLKLNNKNHFNTTMLMIFILLLVSLLLASNLPIYPDEIAYRIMLERFYLSGGFKTSLLPYCLDGFEITPPAILKLSSVFWSTLSQINPNILYRLLPSSLLLFSIISLYAFVNKYAEPKNSWFLVLFISGISVYGLTILRPEVLISSAIIWLSIVGLYVIRLKKSNLNSFELT